MHTPSLTGSGERAHLRSSAVGLDTYVLDIENLFAYLDIRDAVLVGYSFGGMAVTAAAPHLCDRIAHLVYLDAFVPRDGQAFVDLIPAATATRFDEEAAAVGEGWWIPPPDPSDSRMTPLPLKAIRERIHVGDESAMPPRTYIRCISDEAGGAFDDAAARARAEGWGYHELRSSHNPMKDVPDELTVVMLAIPAGRRKPVTSSEGGDVSSR